jgi:formate dehydrogenase subunit gamma
MNRLHARGLGAVILGAALALPLAALAQQSNPQATMGKDAPVTAKPEKEQKPVAPQVVPAPLKGSTAVPGWNNPPASWGVASERRQYASVPGVDTNQLIQSAGREWRAFRNGPITQYGGWLLVLVLALIMLFYLIKGPIKLHGRPTGRLIERFNAVERTAHWTTAISFVALALSGIVILWGKHIVLPWLGYTGFSWLTILAKNLHNFVGPLFVFSIIVMFLLFVKDNLFRSYDMTWIKRFGGMFSKGAEVPSGRFNAGEKAIFWGMLTLLGSIVAVTGLILDFPNWNQGREIMQQANVVHAIAAVLFIAASFGHIYLGTIGMQGAYRAMRDGYVDEEWAREHHALWYEEVKQGRRPEKIIAGTAQPVAGDD